MTQRDGRVFMCDIKQMVLNDSACIQVSWASVPNNGVHPEPDSREYSSGIFLKRDGNIYFLFMYCSIFLKIIMRDEWGRM